MESLIDEYCSAIEKWANATGHSAHDAIYYSMSHSGGVWNVKAEGAVDDPSAPEHRGKTWGEIQGSYTLEQLRKYLLFLCDQIHIPQSTIIPALAREVEGDFCRLATGYPEARERNREEAEKLESMADHPDQYEELLSRMADHSASGEPPTPDRLRQLAAMFRKFIEKDPQQEEAERAQTLTAWRQVTASLLNDDRTHEWFLDDIEAKMASR